MDHRSRKKGNLAEGKQDTDTGTGTTVKTAPISPIHALVPDILVAIFSQALLEQVESDYRPGWNRLVPINVSAVCHEWRKLVLASRLLWSVIKGLEVIGEPWGTASKYPWKQFNLFLHRSGRAPLDISMELRGASQADDALLLSTLYDNQTRLRNIDIHLQLRDSHETSEDLQADWTLTDLPIVEDLKLSRSSRIPVPLELKYAPLLRRLRLTGLGGISSLDTNLILPNLVNIDLCNTGMHQGFSVHDCIMLLQASPSIEEFNASGFTIHGIMDNHHQFDSKPDGITCLPKLTVFSLKRINSETARFMFEALTLPGLHKLSIHLRWESDSATCGVHSFLERSKPALETLDLCIPNALEFKQCLELSVDLRTLYLFDDIWSITGTDELFEHLILKPGVKLCPRLRKIAFGGCPPPPFIYPEVVVMVHSWWNRSALEGGDSLEAVEFLNWTGVREIVIELERLCEGLDIVIKNDYEHSYSEDASDLSSVNSSLDSFDDYCEFTAAQLEYL